MTRTALTHIDLFAGISGFGVGFERAGIKTLAHVEIDKKCQEIIRLHYPDHIILSDVCRAGVHNLPYADIISFGSPCQDLSVAGKRKGLAGGRSGLFYEAVRIVQEICPRYAIWENVPGALSSHGGRDFKSVIESLLDANIPMPKSGRWATAGVVRTGQKEIAWRVLDAQYFGLAQRRKRVFLIFCPRGDSASQVLFEREGMRRDTKTREKKREGITPAIASGINGSGLRGRQPGSAASLISFSLNAKGGSGRIDAESETFIPDIARPLANSKTNDHHDESQQTYIAFMAGQGSKAGSVAASETLSPTLKGAESGTNQVPSIAWQQNTRDEVRYINGDGQITGALSSQPGMKQQNYIGVRRLTPTECERLMGFQDGYTEGQADSVRYRQLGNAVAVPVVEWIAKRISKIVV